MVSRTWSRRTPRSSARWELDWITGPSAIGSENGTPTSIRSAPASSRPRRRSRVPATDGSPAVMYGTNARRCLPLSATNAAAMAPGFAPAFEARESDEIVANADPIAFRCVGLHDRPAKCSLIVAIGEIDDRSRVQEVSLRVADETHQRTRKHFGDQIHGMNDT